MTWAKATNEITGLIRGLLADGEISESEASFLRRWMRDRPELMNDALVACLAGRIERIYSDGVVTAEELGELKQLLEDFSPSSEELPTQLPLDRPAPAIEIPGKSFCFTGKFIAGTRLWCESQILARDGTIKNLPSAYPSVLVIGSTVSGSWRNQTYGKKIEAAVAAKASNRPISIITEAHWLTFIRGDS